LKTNHQRAPFEQNRAHSFFGLAISGRKEAVFHYRNADFNQKENGGFSIVL